MSSPNKKPLFEKKSTRPLVGIEPESLMLIDTSIYTNRVSCHRIVGAQHCFSWVISSVALDFTSALVCSFLRPFVRWFMRLCVSSVAAWLVSWFPCSLACSFARALVPSLVLSLVLLLTRSLARTFVRYFLPLFVRSHKPHCRKCAALSRT